MSLQSLYQVAVRFHEPLVYLVLVILGILSRTVYRIDKNVACLNIEMKLLLASHHVVNNASDTSTDLVRLH